MVFKIVIVVMFLAVLFSLSSGLFFLINDKGGTNRTVKALTFRIAISIAAFALLFIGYLAGWIEPHGVTP